MTAQWWEWLVSAFALVLVLEGIMPFVAPEQWRLLLMRLAKYEYRQIRFFGLAMMLVGLLILYVIHHLL